MEFLHVSHEQIGFIPDTKTLVSLNHGGHPCSLDTFWRMYTFIIGEMLHFPRFELRFSSAGRSNALRSFNFQIYAQIDLRRAAFNPVLDHFESYRAGSVFVIERLEYNCLFRYLFSSLGSVISVLLFLYEKNSRSNMLNFTFSKIVGTINPRSYKIRS